MKKFVFTKLNYRRSSYVYMTDMKSDGGRHSVRAREYDGGRGQDRTGGHERYNMCMCYDVITSPIARAGAPAVVREVQWRRRQDVTKKKTFSSVTSYSNPSIVREVRAR